MWIFYWICFTGWCLTGGPVLFVSLFWLWRGNEPWGARGQAGKVQPEAPAAPAGGPASPDATTRRRPGRVGVDSGVEESKE